MEEELRKKYGYLMLYMITAARILYAQYWKKEHIPTIEEWMFKLLKLAQMAKLTILMKDKNISRFKELWQPLLDYLLITERNEVMMIGFIY